MRGDGRDDADRPKLTYRDAGVDIDAQDEALRRIKSMVQSTRTPGVLADLGAFGGLFAPDLSEVSAPVLVASADGVGTKLKIAFTTGVHDTVGQDLVNHCVNDILVQGARPLFFMDYIATGKLEPGVLASVVEGVARGCRDNGCALLGGETAEMPGFYGEGEYDVAGFLVGLVDRDKVLDGSAIRPGDLLVGLPSTGLHTNGYSLARKIFFEIAGLGVDSRVDEIDATAGEALLRVHRSYLRPLERPVSEGWLKGLAHITGGGIPDNLPRILPPETSARIERGSWPVPPVFSWMQRVGHVDALEMDRTFNMGIGMVVVVNPENASLLENHLDAVGEGHHRIGTIDRGDGGVLYE
jgi:phosphoribosylformylglycinamidine cyclo-ligase